MKDCFIIERENFGGMFGIRKLCGMQDYIRIMYKEENETLFEYIDVNTVKISSDFVACEREIPSFYK